MKIFFVCLIILSVWVVGFFCFEWAIKKVATKQRKRKIKDILFDQADYKIVRRRKGDKLLLKGRLFEL